jgi:hypothetical protein
VRPDRRAPLARPIGHVVGAARDRQRAARAAVERDLERCEPRRQEQARGGTSPDPHRDIERRACLLALVGDAAQGQPRERARAAHLDPEGPVIRARWRLDRARDAGSRAATRHLEALGEAAREGGGAALGGDADLLGGVEVGLDAAGFDVPGRAQGLAVVGLDVEQQRGRDLVEQVGIDVGHRGDAGANDDRGGQSDRRAPSGEGRCGRDAGGSRATTPQTSAAPSRVVARWARRISAGPDAVVACALGRRCRRHLGSRGA